ncbi:MAG: class I SAM-dependent methyltransferase [Myxococcales bacterium]|nr:class I SAM-dependent methyltransferase [Myxococcales bacterium]
MADLYCPPCAGQGHRQLLATGLRCQQCGRRWPAFAGGTDFIAVLLPDPDASARMVGLVSALMRDPNVLSGWHDGEDPLENALAGGLLTYAQAHFGAYARPALAAPDLSWLARAWPTQLPPGPIVILGCATGGEAWALRKIAGLAGREVWMVDANLAALAWGQMLFDNGTVMLPYRPTATRIDWCPAELPESAPPVRWLCADALFPPFAGESVAAVVTVGLLDSVSDPAALVQQIEALLKPNGVWLMASPWNWQPRVTPVRRQLERHLPGGVPDGMAALLTGQVIAGLASDFTVEWRNDDVPWRLQVHARYVAEYRLQVMRLRKHV